MDGQTSYNNLRPDQTLRDEGVSILDWQTSNTVKISEKNKQFYIETDKNFIASIQRIIKMKQGSFFVQKAKHRKTQLTEEQMNQIEFIARTHRQANIFNQSSKQAFEEIPDYNQCKCGCKKGKGDPIPFCSSIQKFDHLGSGPSLFFYFAKSFILIVLLCSLIYSAYAVTVSIMGRQAVIPQFCQYSEYCVFKHKVSAQNQRAIWKIYTIKNWLGCGMCLVLLFLIKFVKAFGQQKHEQITIKKITPSDYSVMISNLPVGEYDEKQLIQTLMSSWRKRIKKLKEKKDKKLLHDDDYKSDDADFYGDDQYNFGMSSIKIIYNMEFSRKLVSKIFQLSQYIDFLLKQREGYPERNVIINVSQYKEKKKYIFQSYQLLLDLKKRFLSDPLFRKKLTTSSCLLQFKRKDKQQEMLAFFENSDTSLLSKKFNEKAVNFKGNVLAIQRSPQPSSIIWENCESEYSFCKSFLVIFLTLLILIFSFGALFGLQLAADYVTRRHLIHQSLLIAFINFFMSLIILTFNKIIWQALISLVKIQKINTKTTQIISQMKGLLIASSTNFIILPMITKIVVGRDFYSGKGLSGFIIDYQVTVLAWLILTLLNPVNIWKKIVIEIRCFREILLRYYSSQYISETPYRGIPQVNSFYQYPVFDLAENYVFIIGSLYHAVFFCYLQPLALPILFLTSIVFYFLSKLKLVQMAKIPQKLEVKVFLTSVHMLAIVPIMYGVGSLLLGLAESSIRKDVQVPFISSSVSIFIGFIGFWNPLSFLDRFTEKILTRFSSSGHLKKMNNHNAQYSENNNDEIGDVSDENPLSKNIEYYENSNTLNLIGFQQILKGRDKNEKIPELKNFCESFFHKKQEKIGFFSALRSSVREKSQFQNSMKFSGISRLNTFRSRQLAPLSDRDFYKVGTLGIESLNKFPILK